MHIAPFHLKTKNSDFLGYIRLAPTRRDKNKLRVHVATGADLEHVIDLPITINTVTGESYFEYSYAALIGQWMSAYGMIEDEFGVDDSSILDDNDYVDESKFNQLLAQHGAKVRIW